MAEEANWFGNLLNAFIVAFIGSYVAMFNFIFVIIGMPEFGAQFLVDLGMYGSKVSSLEVQFN